MMHGQPNIKTNLLSLKLSCIHCSNVFTHRRNSVLHFCKSVYYPTYALYVTLFVTYVKSYIFGY